jgi:beta-glucanase (GH16 family)
MSQSLQLAPFDAGYWPFNTSSDYTQYDSSITRWNSYRGGNLQQAVSSLTWVPDGVYQNTSQQFNTYGMEWYANTNDRDNGYVAWIASGVRSWTVHASAMAPNPKSEIGQRIIPEEPMYLIMNFGMSNNFQAVTFAQLDFPNEMHVGELSPVWNSRSGRCRC